MGKGFCVSRLLTGQGGNNGIAGQTFAIFSRRDKETRWILTIRYCKAALGLALEYIINQYPSHL